MTLEELERMDREYLIPKEVAGVLGCAPYAINVAAKQNPEVLGFPVTLVGTRAKIPKRPFLNYMRYGRPEDEVPRYKGD